jgi:hypothetical protein
MVRTSVVSSVIMSAGYDSERSVLEIEFRRGDVYEYFLVPESVFRALLAAPSKGRFLQREINRTYRSVRVDALSDASEDDTDGIPGWPQLD